MSKGLDKHEWAAQLRSMSPEAWDERERNQRLLRAQSFKVLSRLLRLGVEEAGSLQDMLWKHKTQGELLPVGLDDIAFELAKDYKLAPSPDKKSLASLARAASFVVGVEAIYAARPMTPNLPVLRKFANEEIQGADIPDSAKAALVQINTTSEQGANLLVAASSPRWLYQGDRELGQA